MYLVIKEGYHSLSYSQEITAWNQTVGLAGIATSLIWTPLFTLLKYRGHSVRGLSPGMAEPDTAGQGWGHNPKTTQQSESASTSQTGGMKESAVDLVLPVSGFLPIPQHLKTIQQEE